MNAYKLADKLEKGYGSMGGVVANMLRQQAQEISTLSDRIAEFEKENQNMEASLKERVENSIKNLTGKQARIYFLVQDTKGNAKASVIFDSADISCGLLLI